MNKHGDLGKRWCAIFCTGMLWIGCAGSSSAFALLGPFTSWMTPEVGYQFSPDSTFAFDPPVVDEIGGPMNLGDEYRWNVPVLTYGFDLDFLDYFGEEGVAEIEAAVQILNALPPASELQLSSHPLDWYGVNYSATFQRLVDLRSVALSALVEQMGLAAPVRNVFTMHLWDPVLNWVLRDCNFEACFSALPCAEVCVFKRNFDPDSAEPSSYVNGLHYTYRLLGYGTHGSPAPPVDAVEFVVDPLAHAAGAAADWTTLRGLPIGFLSGGVSGWGRYGSFTEALSRDDAGGVRYLLHRTNLNVESAMMSVTAVTGDNVAFVRTAFRPGVDKIIFLRHGVGEAGQFLTLTNYFEDIIAVGDNQTTQAVQRLIGEPDILFSARDLGFQLVSSDSIPAIQYRRALVRTDTAHWHNNSSLNGRPGGAGPGVILPPVTITFHTPGRYRSALGAATNRHTVNVFDWARITKTNAVTLGRHDPNLTSLTLLTRTFGTNLASVFEWFLLGREGGCFRIESSTNGLDWQPAASLTNSTGILKFVHPLTEPCQLFRARRVE